MIIDIIFFIPLLVIGAIASLSDYRYKKISNQLVFISLLIGLSILLVLVLWNENAKIISEFFYYKLLGRPDNYPITIITFYNDYFQSVINNFLISIIFSYFVWKLDYWAAGDAKLFIVYSLFFPLTHYWRSYFPAFPAISLFLNIFTLIFIYYFLLSCNFWLKEIWRKKKESIKLFDKENLKKIFYRCLFSLEILYLIIIFFSTIQKFFIINLANIQIVVFCLFIVFAKNIFEYFHNKKRQKILLSVFSILLFFSLLTDFIFTVNMLKNTLITSFFFMIIFLIFNSVIDGYFKNRGVVILPISNLRPGMLFSQENEDEYDNFKNKRLDKGDIESIILLSKEKGFEKAKINATSPLAQWFLIGAILTFFLNGSLLFSFAKYMQEIIARFV